MRYQRVPHRLLAEVLNRPWASITLTRDQMKAEVGDFRVTDPRSSRQWPITRVALRSGYVAVDSDSYESRGEVSARRVGPANGNSRVVSMEGRRPRVQATGS